MDDKNCHVPPASLISPYLPLDPPVTKRSLSCLDLPIILSGIRLLHDVVMDRYVEFHPNHGEIVATQRREEERQFWQALHNGLETSSTPSRRALLVESYGIKADWCFPRFLRGIKEILVTVIHTSDHGIVEEGLNVDEVMQEYYECDLKVALMAE